jgi:hypothetical protein
MMGLDLFLLNNSDKLIRGVPSHFCHTCKPSWDVEHLSPRLLKGFLLKTFSNLSQLLEYEVGGVLNLLHGTSRCDFKVALVK